MANIQAHEVERFKQDMTLVLDEGLYLGPKTSFMASVASQVTDFHGRKVISVPSFDVKGGLVDYDVESGKYGSDIGTKLTWKDYELDVDRAFRLTVDRKLVNDTAGLVNIQDAHAKLIKEYVIPEMDAYRMAKACGAAVELSKKSGNAKGDYVKYGVTITASNIQKEIDDVLVNYADKYGIGVENLVMLATPQVIQAYRMSVDNKIENVDFSNGYTNVCPSYNGLPIVEMQSRYMNTAITLLGDRSVAAGWKTATGNKKVNFVIMRRDLISCASLIDELKIFTPEENQSGSDWLAEGRIVYGAFRMDKNDVVFANIKDTEA